MNFAAVRSLTRLGRRNFRSFHNSYKRKGAEPPKSQDPCKCESKPPSKPSSEPCPPKPSPDCSHKTESHTPPASQPPPCSIMPKTPPRVVCNQSSDPNNPCNYTPPPCRDPEYPDLKRLKKFQCLFQEDNGLPVYLKRGNLDAILFQGTILLVLISLGGTCYSLLKIAKIIKN